MEFQKLAWILGAALTVGAGGMTATACGSSSGGPAGGGSGGGSGSGSGGGSDSGPDVSVGDDGGTGGDTGPAVGDGGGGPDCGKIPSLHPEPAAGDIYCGFGGADGGSVTCSTGNECCLGGGTAPNYDPQACAPWTATGAGCTNPGEDAGKGSSIGIACNQVADCTANGVSGAVACCITGSPKGPTAVAGCGYSKATSGSAVICEGTVGAADGGGTSSTGTCAAGEVQVCQADVDCPTGMHCGAGKWKIFQLGFCQ